MSDYAELVKSYYTELVKSLRNRWICLQSGGNEDDFGLWIQAADAIEELSEQLLEMGQVGKFLLDVHKINSKMVAPESVPTDSEWWSHYKALLELLYLPRWIPVTERLPEIKEHHVSDVVLVCLDDGGMAFSELEENIFGQVWFDIERPRPDGESDYTVTHWMPLPEPPKEETE